MKIVFEVNHPKHFYQFQKMSDQLKQNNEIYFFARNKEIVFKILDEENIKYYSFGNHYKSLLGKIFGSIEIFFRYNKLIRKIKPDLVVSKASPYSTILAKINKYKTVIFPDSEIVVLTNKLVARLADVVITPKFFPISYGKKQFSVNGLFEETYLGKDVFQPNDKIRDILQKDGRGYAILRFVSWNANHDVGKSAVSSQLIEKIVFTIKQYLNVYITCEATLPDNLTKYELPIPKNKIHSALFYADLYVGDSQSMATESALLGTPAIRCNKFVGDHDMNIFNILEKEYNLLLNFSDWDSALSKINEICRDPQIGEAWKLRAEGYYKSKTNLNTEIVEIINKISQ